MHAVQVQRVLYGLGFNEPPGSDLAGLTALYSAWCRKVPFDNFLKRLHIASGDSRPLPGDTPAEFFESWLAFGTGGTCWAGNGALCALLQALGFDAVRGIATMVVAPGIPPNHGTVTVKLEGTRYIVDASILHETPLVVPSPDRPTRVDNPAWGVEARFEDGHAMIRWRPFHVPVLDCRIDQLEAEVDDFKRYHEVTRSWSPFNYSLSARRVHGDEVVGLAFGKLGRIHSDGTVELQDCSDRERVEFLVDELGISESIASKLPPDEELPPPPEQMRSGAGA